MTDPDTFATVDPRWWLANTGGVVVTGVLAAATGRPALRRIFRAAVAIHVTEALYSYRAARRAGFTASAPRWALQTLGVGFPSLIALHAAIQVGAPKDEPSGARDLG
jgi:hypothetical protein